MWSYYSRSWGIEKQNFEKKYDFDDEVHWKLFIISILSHTNGFCIWLYSSGEGEFTQGVLGKIGN